MINIKRYLFLFLLIATVGFAQQPVQTSVDSTKIKIGSQFNLTLKVKGTKQTRIAFPESKSFGQLEVLESFPVDTIKKDATYEFIKKYGLTQFDSGRYVIPRIPVLIGNKQFLSDSAVIEVNNVVVDTLKQKMYDIKPIVEVKDPTSNFWWYLLGIVLLGGLGFLGYWLYKKYQNRPKEEVIVYASPIEKATILLKNLEKKSFLEHGDVKTNVNIAGGIGFASFLQNMYTNGGYSNLRKSENEYYFNAGLFHRLTKNAGFTAEGWFVPRQNFGLLGLGIRTLKRKEVSWSFGFYNAIYKL